jgi:hypothetical protein
VSQVLERIESLAGGVYDLPVCWTITLLAAIRKTDDLDYLALDRIERCIGASDALEHRIGAFSLKAQALFMFNQLPAAVEASQLALDCAMRRDDPDTLASCRVNVATYLAELGDERMGPQAKELMAAVRDFRKDDLSQDQLDTLGLVEIVFAGTPEEVDHGLELCRKALEKDPTNPVAERYFDLRKLVAEDKRVQIAARKS